MNPKEYEKNVLITESTDFEPIKARIDERMIRLLHAGLGMSSELTELTDAAYKENVDWVNIAEEGADILWYTAVAVNALGLDHDAVSRFESSVVEEKMVCAKNLEDLEVAIASATCAAGEYNDFLKKHLFYGKPLNVEKLTNALSKMCASVSGICVIAGMSIEEARDRNINKLKIRYGQKFTEAAALNRDLETERKALEGKTT